MSEQEENQEVIEDQENATEENSEEANENLEQDEDDSDSEAEQDSDESEGEDSETSESDEEKGKPNLTKQMAKRIAKVKRREEQARREAEKAARDAEYWKQKALGGKDHQEIEPTKNKSNEKPDPDNFDTQEDYIDALTDWKLDAFMKSKEEAQLAQAKQDEYKSTAEKWQENINKFASENSDFEDAMENLEDINVSDSVRDALLECELGPKILYELGKNPEEALRISKLSPYAAIREIGKLEAKFQDNPVTKKETKKTTNAPKPLSTIKGSGGGGSKTIYSENLSQPEYEALRRKQLAQAN